THNAAQKMTLEAGEELSAALGIGAFVENTLVHAGQCTKVNPEAKPEVAGLLGCGMMAGIGAPMPAIIPQPSSPATSGFASGFTLVHCPACTSVFSTKAPMP